MTTNTVETPEKNVAGQQQGAVAVSSGAAAQNNLRNIGLIIGREYSNLVKRRSFIITSVLLLVIVFLAAFIPTVGQLITARTPTPTQIVVVNDAGTVAGLNDVALTSYIRTELNGTNTRSQAPYAISSQPATNLGNLQSQVKQGQLDILLVLNRAANQNVRFLYDTNASATNDSNLSTIQGLAQLLTFLDTAHRLGLTSQETQRLVAPPDLTVTRTQQSQKTLPQSESTASYVLATAGVILIFISVAIVAEEKSSRMMEILVNAATPFQLLAGKIVGIGAACLTQMGCLVAVGIAALLLQTPLQAALFGPHAGGFSQYLTGVSIPFYLLFLLTIATPDATLPKVLSYIPFWTPIFMRLFPMGRKGSVLPPPNRSGLPLPLQAEEGRCSGERPPEGRNEKNKLINYFAADDSLRSATPVTQAWQMH